jgi:iron complex transport system ATP-binding protein
MVDALGAENLGVERGKRLLLHGVSLAARHGELLAIVGPNGAGKSTLLKALLGILPHSGEVRLGAGAHGRELSQLSARERARAVAYVPQRSELGAGISVHDVVAQARYARHGGLLGFGEGHDDVVDRALARVGLAALAGRAYDTLSGGEQRRVLTARALASEARVLLLDEPTAGLDVAQVLRFFALLAELRRDGYALVCVLHDLADVLRHADRALLLSQGSAVASGPTHEVLSAEHIRAVYGVHSHAGAALGFSLHGDYT